MKLDSFLKNKTFWIVVTLLVVILFSYKFVTKMTEGFDLETNSSSEKSIPDQYKYLAPLPEGSIWSPEFQDKYVAKKKEQDPNSNITKEDLNKPNPFFANKSLMQMASESEAQYYLDSGLWPYDDYVINYLKTDWDGGAGMKDQDVEYYRKIYPNRVIYINIANETVPQLKFLNEINSQNFHKAENDKYWNCKDGQLQVKDGEAGIATESTDYSFFPTNVSGFSYNQESCNVCSIKHVNGLSMLDVYNSPENTCKFNISGDIPEAYNIYMGEYGDAKLSSSPASTTSTTSNPSPITTDEYNKCVQSCDKYN